MARDGVDGRREARSQVDPPWAVHDLSTSLLASASFYQCQHASLSVIQEIKRQTQRKVYNIA